MKTLIEIPTRGDEMTQPGGIALRYNTIKNEFVVHNFNTDRETETERHYFGGGYYFGDTNEGLADGLALALEDLAKRVRRAGGYDTGGALDLDRVGIPKPIRDTLEAGLERRADLFFDNQEAFGDYTEEDEEEFRKEQNAASRWLSEN